MAKLDQVVAAFRECDRTLRAAISAAAPEADPEQLNKLVGWLREVQRVLHDASPSHAPALATDATASRSSEPHMKAAHAKYKSASRIRVKYPLFFRESDGNLVKIGWSKKSRAEYEHKAPRDAMSAVVRTMAEAGKNRRRFVMEKLMPFRDQVSGAPVPDYQAYIVLAWLRSEGVVIQHGRQGYTLSNGKVSAEVVDKLWNSVPTR